jgi:hypothetical protein
LVRHLGLALLLPFVLAVTGCHTTGRRGGEGMAAKPKVFIYDPVAHAVEHGLDTNRVVNISWKKKCNPIWWFGNEEQPAPPDKYRPNNPCRRVLWYFRNPLNNFTFYIVGIADKPFERVGRTPDKTFNPDGGWNWAVCKRNCLRLPFVSYQHGRFKFYAGWRNRGNLGFKFNFEKAKPPKPASADSPPT